MLENFIHDPVKNIYNFLDYKLSESEKSVSYKGVEFAIPPNKLEYADFILIFELLSHDVRNTDLSILQTKTVKSKLFSSFDSFNSNEMRSNLSKEKSKSLHNLRKLKRLVNPKAGKGNTVVITKKNLALAKYKKLFLILPSLSKKTLQKSNNFIFF